MMNKFLNNLNKIEFAVTFCCSGRCKHCSEGDHALSGEQIDPAAASEAVKKIASAYDIKTVMTFGGEPLLYLDTVCTIMTAAHEMNVPRRQVITNGYFSHSTEYIRLAAARLADSGVNDLLLSADAFHQEYIPLDTVKVFADEVKKCGIPLRLQPAWLVSAVHDNPYNRKTREILDSFSELDIPASEGNIIFPEGNAKKYLAEYFTSSVPENPYTEDPCDVKCISFSPNGDVLGENIYKRDIMDILRDYDPMK